MDHACTRSVRACRLLIDYYGVNTAPLQFRGQGKPGRSRADYKNLIFGSDIEHETPSSFSGEDRSLVVQQRLAACGRCNNCKPIMPPTPNFFSEFLARPCARLSQLPSRSD
jgi:hypothetical protein